MHSLRNLRPKIHFTPPNMWMNDPNGMYYENGNYHLFYQKHPNSCVWGSMHWGHAISKDLINWVHLPIALYPDELGQVFSGSCVYDIENISGYGTKENPPVIAMYTSHGDFEQQSLAYSLDKIHFEKKLANPVIENHTQKDFRDPKLFYNKLKGGYTAIIAAGDRAIFYFTKNFKDWEKTGEFGPLAEKIKGVWECPDMVKINCDGEDKWVFILSQTLDSEGSGLKTFYFVGDFDGNTFIETDKQSELLTIDVCYDNYAGVTFQNTAKPIFMGWALCWAYASDVPTGSNFRGQMTLARELDLVNTVDGYRLKSIPVGIDRYKPLSYNIKKSGTLYTETFYMQVEGTGNCEIKLMNTSEEILIITLTESEFIIDRSKAGLKDFNKNFNSEKFLVQHTKRPILSKIDICIIFDVSVAEVFACDGFIAACTTVYPQSPYDAYEVTGDVQVKFCEI